MPFNKVKWAFQTAIKMKLAENDNVKLYIVYTVCVIYICIKSCAVSLYTIPLSYLYEIAKIQYLLYMTLYHMELMTYQRIQDIFHSDLIETDCMCVCESQYRISRIIIQAQLLTHMLHTPKQLISKFSVNDKVSIFPGFYFPSSVG